MYYLSSVTSYNSIVTPLRKDASSNRTLRRVVKKTTRLFTFGWSHIFACVILCNFDIVILTERSGRSCVTMTTVYQNHFSVERGRKTFRKQYENDSVDGDCFHCIPKNLFRPLSDCHHGLTTNVAIQLLVARPLYQNCHL